HLDLHAIADLAHAIDLVDVFVVEFANVAQTIATGQDLNEGAEIFDRGDSAVVDLADADFLRERFDLGPGGLGAGSDGVRDVHGTVVIDIDLGAGRFLDPLDCLAAGADQEADFFRINLEREQPRRLRTDFTAW